MEHLRSTAAILLLAVCSPLAAQQGAQAPPEQPPTVVRTLSSPDNRVTIPIRIDGRGPWNFVVDTGSQRTVISRDLAEKLALPPRRPVTIVSMTGRTEVQTVALTRLGYGAVTVDDIEAPVLEGADLGAPGLLGLDSLHAKRLLLNFRTGRMEVSSSRKAWRDPDAIIVEARRRKGQLILLHCQANGMKVDVILDTGTHISVGNLALLDKLMRKKHAPGLSTISTVSVTGETLTGQLGHIRQVSMGTIGMKDLPVMFADALPFKELGLSDKPALLLGIHALRTFDRVAIDFGRGKVDFLLPDGSALDGRRIARRSSAAG